MPNTKSRAHYQVLCKWIEKERRPRIAIKRGNDQAAAQEKPPEPTDTAGCKKASGHQGKSVSQVPKGNQNNDRGMGIQRQLSDQDRGNEPHGESGGHSCGNPLCGQRPKRFPGVPRLAADHEDGN